MRRERDNQESATRRAATLEAEARRQQNRFPSGFGAGPGGGSSVAVPRLAALAPPD
jgi:hypothetical protein